MHPQRKNVLLIGSAAVDGEEYDRLQKHFIEHGLNLVRSAIDQIENNSNSACGILIAEGGDKIGFIRSCFEILTDNAEDSGLAFGVLIPSSVQLQVVERVVRELHLKSRVTVNLSQYVGNAAEFLARWNPGPPTGELTVLPPSVNLSARMLLLLRRSFHDCAKVYLEPLGGGRDAAGVFCVHAWLRKSIVGPRPLPFFIKFSTPSKIERERSNYEYYADFYIPFYLRPNVVPGRCAQIKGLACLVGNFVEDAVPLRTALRAGQSPGIIFSLFEISLRGFRSQAVDGASATWEERLDAFARKCSRAVEVTSETLDRARSQGLKKTPIEIEAALCTAIGQAKRRFGPYHGDLHTGNIMVRGKDAILIDFSAVKNGPLTADPAALEVSLIFGTDTDDNLKLFDEWKEAVNQFYEGVPIHEPPSLGTTPGPFSWLYRSVREIRHVLLGCDCKQEEAAEVLATYLLRFARLPPETFDNEDLSNLARLRHSYALVVAEKIVDSLLAAKGMKPT